MCPVLRSATAIKMKSRDQAHRQATIKGSRRFLDQKSDQNQDDFAMPCIFASHTLQSQEKEGLVAARTTSCSRGMQKTSRVTANRAGPAICARAAGKALLSNLSNLIGRDKILSPEQVAVREVTRPSFS